MRKAQTFTASLLVSFLISLALIFYFQPTKSLPTNLAIVLILIVEFGSFIVARILTDKIRGRILIKVLLYAAVTSAILTFLLSPINNLGFAYDFLVVVILEIVGYLLALVLV